MNMHIGFIGLGNMGNPMARNLIEAGFHLTVHDLDRSAAENLIALGAAWAEDPRALAARSRALITSLPGPLQVEAVMDGENGARAGLKAGSTWIDMTTNSPALVKRMAVQLAERGISVLDAPVTGAVDGAQAGTLTIFVGGEAKTFERHRPIFDVIAEKTFHAGQLGAGLAAKLLTNLLWFINAVAIGEGMILGAKAGIELPTLWEIIKSSAGNSWVAEHDVPSIFAGHYDPTFTLDLCVKDLRLIHELGEYHGVPLELGGLVQQIFRRAQVQYGGDQGELHVVRLLEDVTGTHLQTG